MAKKKRFRNVSLLSNRIGKKFANHSCSLLIINNLQTLAVGKETSF